MPGIPGAQYFHTVIPGELAQGARQFRLGDKEFHAFIDITPPLECPEGFLGEASSAAGMGSKAIYLGNLVTDRNPETQELTYSSRIHFLARTDNKSEAKQMLERFSGWLETALAVVGEPSAQAAQASTLYAPLAGKQR